MQKAAKQQFVSERKRGQMHKQSKAKYKNNKNNACAVQNERGKRACQQAVACQCYWHSFEVPNAKRQMSKGKHAQCPTAWMPYAQGIPNAQTHKCTKYVKCSNAQTFKCTNAQMVKCSNAQMLTCTNAQMHKCTSSNAQMHKCSNA